MLKKEDMEEKKLSQEMQNLREKFDMAKTCQLSKFGIYYFS